MSRNYGIGTRDMISAGRQWLQRSGISYSSVATLSQRWSDFARFAKDNDVGSMERITKDLVQSYADHLIDRGLSASSIQNRLSAINTVMSTATKGAWQSLSPRSLGAPARSYVRQEAPKGLDRGLVEQATKGIDARAAAIVNLTRELGLRSKEATLINAKGALKEALSKGEVRITEGTKGGRPRVVKITNDHQIAALEKAAAVQGKSGSLIPEGVSYKGFRSVIDHAREAIKATTGQGLHALRASFSCDFYKDYTGKDAPVVAGFRLVGKDLDREARQQIAQELGHGRTDVTVAYLGSAR